MASPETSPESASFKVIYGTRRSPGRPRFYLMGTMSFGPKEAVLEQGKFRGTPKALLDSLIGCAVLVVLIVGVVSSQHNSLPAVGEDVGIACAVCGIVFMAGGFWLSLMVSGIMDLMRVPRHRFVLARGAVDVELDARKGVLGFQVPDGPYVTVKLKPTGLTVPESQLIAFRGCVEEFFAGPVGPSVPWSPEG